MHFKYTYNSYAGEEILVISEDVTEIEAPCLGEQLKEVYIPGSIKKIEKTHKGKSIFSYCNKIHLSEGIEIIGERAFEPNNVIEIKLPKSLSVIEKYAFAQSRELRQITIPKGVREISTATFFGCYNLQKVTLLQGVEIIGDGAFEACFELRNVKLPNTLKEIGVRAFRKCYKLKTLYVPDGVQKIGDIAFDSCESLESLSIPASCEVANYLGDMIKDCNIVRRPN